MNLIDKQFEYNLWANTELIKLCNQLTAEQLEVEVAGIFGRIHPTIVHLLRAEGGYLHRVTGSRPWANDLDWDAMSFDELLEKAKLSGQRLIDIASTADLAQQHVIDYRGDNVERQGEKYVFYSWTSLAQAFYHGVEHRTQIKVLLTRLGVKHSDFSLWDYVETMQ